MKDHSKVTQLLKAKGYDDNNKKTYFLNDNEKVKVRYESSFDALIIHLYSNYLDLTKCLLFKDKISSFANEYFNKFNLPFCNAGISSPYLRVDDSFIIIVHLNILECFEPQLREWIKCFEDSSFLNELIFCIKTICETNTNDEYDNIIKYIEDNGFKRIMRDSEVSKVYNINYDNTIYSHKVEISFLNPAVFGIISTSDFYKKLINKFNYIGKIKRYLESVLPEHFTVFLTDTYLAIKNYYLSEWNSEERVTFFKNYIDTFSNAENVIDLWSIIDQIIEEVDEEQ